VSGLALLAVRPCLVRKVEHGLELDFGIEPQVGVHDPQSNLVVIVLKLDLLCVVSGTRNVSHKGIARLPLIVVLLFPNILYLFVVSVNGAITIKPFLRRVSRVI